MKYIKQLDSLRAIAAMLVIIWHWLPNSRHINALNNGSIGVNLFFVLSGFLITAILLKNRNEAERLQTNKLAVIKNFYARRALRIFPIYYLTILVIVLFQVRLGATLTHAELVNSLFYTSNFYILNAQQWPDLTTHFWSLAVEEQFYLLWPFVVLFIPKRYILPAILLFLGTGIVTECFITSPEFGFVATPTCFDAFGTGALLAWVSTYNTHLLKQAYSLLGILALLCLILLLAQIPYGVFAHVPQRMVQSVIAVWIIVFILLNHHKRKMPFGFVWNNKVLLFLGKISYGIYLYHLPILWFGFIWKPLFQLPFFSRFYPWSLFALNFALLVCVAYLSWMVIEKPMLQFKKWFTYQKQLPKRRSLKQPVYRPLFMQRLWRNMGI